jgi:hypothetical protein
MEHEVVKNDLGSLQYSESGQKPRSREKITSYDNNPIMGWIKEIVINSEGATSVCYVPPQNDGQKHKKIRSKVDLQNYLSITGQSKDLMKRFTFGNVFCVCHVPEDFDKYFGCASGRYGCNKWFHAHCIGVEEENKLTQWSVTKELVCPLCTAYIMTHHKNEMQPEK